MEEQVRASHLRVVEHHTHDQAVAAAAAAAGSTAGHVLTGLLYRQGIRLLVGLAAPLAWLANRVTHMSPGKEAGIMSVADARQQLNRPLVENHAQNICRYLLNNMDQCWTMPALLVTVSDSVEFHTTAGDAPSRTGLLVLPASVECFAVDGQHRLAAARTALDKLGNNTDARKRFGEYGVAVQFTFETRVAQLHQDFADLAKGRELPNSLTALFDMRDPIGRVCAELEARVPLFHGRIDATSSAIAANSPLLFRMAAVRQAVKTALSGNHATNEHRCHAVAERIIGEEESLAEYADKLVAFFVAASDVVLPWRRIARSEQPVETITEIRKRGDIALTPSVLLTLARVAHVWWSTTDDWEARLQFLTGIDWAPTAHMWNGNIVRMTNGGHRMESGPSAIRDAADAIMRLADEHDRGRQVA